MSLSLEHLASYFQPVPLPRDKEPVRHPEAAPDCPHPLCGYPMFSIGDGVYECPHDHRVDPPEYREPTRFPDVPLE